MFEKIKKFFQSVYQRLIHLKDTPHRIAGGFAIGIFFGILPGAGPMAAIIMAWVFRVNRIAAFAGGLLTNTWLSVVTLVAAVKIGAFVTGSDWNQVLADCKEVLRDFSWRGLFDQTVLDILKPVFIGYLVVGLLCGCLAYVVAWVIVKRRQDKKGAPPVTRRTRTDWSIQDIKNLFRRFFKRKKRI
jgi:uncharacterized protein